MLRIRNVTELLTRVPCVTNMLSEYKPIMLSEEGSDQNVVFVLILYALHVISEIKKNIISTIHINLFFTRAFQNNMFENICKMFEPV